jgi:hypothetical protein
MPGIGWLAAARGTVKAGPNETVRPEFREVDHASAF